MERLSNSSTKSRELSVLLSVLDNYGGSPFDEVYDVVVPVYGDKDVEEAFKFAPRCAMVIWGGGDISPTIYGQEPNKYSGATAELSQRDAIEVACAQMAIKLGIPIIGICRGAQLMCALSGGSLVQHVENHGSVGYHKIKTNDGREINCPTVHHQMMFPYRIPEWELIAWCDPARSPAYYGPPKKDKPEECEMLKLEGPEPEIIWIPATKSLCIQSHPEFVSDTKHPFVVYANDLVRRYCLPAYSAE